MDFLNEMAKHRFGDFKIRNHTIFHRTNRHNVTGSPSQHLLGFKAYRQHIGGSGLNGHHRGLPQDNTLIPDIHQRVGCPEIDSNIIGKKAFKLR